MHLKFWSVILLFLFFIGPHLRHMEVPRLGVKLELQLSAYATDTAMPDPRHIGDICPSLWQCRILNPLSEARDQPASSWILVGFLTHWATTGTPIILFFKLPLCNCQNERWQHTAWNKQLVTTRQKLDHRLKNDWDITYNMGQWKEEEIKHGCSPFGSSKHSNIRSHTRFHLCPSWAEMGSPKHTVTVRISQI